MAKRSARAKESEGGMVSSGGPVKTTTNQNDGTAAAVDQKIMGFAEDLGTLLGTAEKKASEWLAQRQAVAEQLSRIRDTANELLTQLTGAGADFATAVQRGRRRGRPPGSRKRTSSSVAAAARRRPGRPKGPAKKRGMSPEGRARVAAAQKARWAKIRSEAGKE
jgi:hypothetical protein